MVASAVAHLSITTPEPPFAPAVVAADEPPPPEPVLSDAAVELPAPLPPLPPPPVPPVPPVAEPEASVIFEAKPFPPFPPVVVLPPLPPAADAPPPPPADLFKLPAEVPPS